MKTKKIKRQVLIVTIPQLQDLVVNLSRDLTDADCLIEHGYGSHKFQLNIINKTPDCSDTWEIEDAISFNEMEPYGQIKNTLKKSKEDFK